MTRANVETAGLIQRWQGAKQGGKMYYVYLIRSASAPKQRYVGFTEDLKQRIADHNAGRNPSTAPYRPWRLVTYLAFSNKHRALSFQRYPYICNGYRAVLIEARPTRTG